MTTVKTSRVLMGAIIAASLLGGLVGPPDSRRKDLWAIRGAAWRAGAPLPILLGSANLTAEQRTQVQAILASRRAGIRALIRDVQQAQDELADKLLTPGPSSSATCSRSSPRSARSGTGSCRTALR